MTNQEAFDRICEHLIRQGRPAVGDDGLCAYRGEGGTACAIGGILPDELYRPGIEGSNIRGLIECRPDVAKYFAGVDADLLARLQNAHDRWARRMEDAVCPGVDLALLVDLDRLAAEWGLTSSSLPR